MVVKSSGFLYLFFLLAEGHRSEPEHCFADCRDSSGHKRTFLAVVEQACLLQAHLTPLTKKTKKTSWAESPLGGSISPTLERSQLASFNSVANEMFLFQMMKTSFTENCMAGLQTGGGFSHSCSLVFSSMLNTFK